MQETNCSCGHLAVVGTQCRTCYQREYRKRKRNDGSPVYKASITVTCVREGCQNTVSINGPRRRMFEETGKGAYCSRECQAEVSQVKVACVGCGTELTRYKSTVEKNKTGRFICDDCLSSGVSRQPHRGSKRVCEGCGVTFYRKPRDKNARFHSRDCRTRYEKKQHVTLVCEGCGTEFETIRAIAERGRRYHDKTCKDLAMITNPVPGQWHNGKPKRFNSDRPGDYILIWEPAHPRAFQGGWVLEHRYVMEKAIGRVLLPTETVHRKKGGFEGRSNNDLSNLELWSSRRPRGRRVEDIVEYCRQMLSMYGSDAERAACGAYLSAVVSDMGTGEDAEAAEQEMLDA